MKSTKINYISIFLLNFVFLNILLGDIFAQIKVFERSNNESNLNETIFNSDTRIKIDLCGNWEVSFDNSDNYTSFNVPFATDYQNSYNIKRDFKVSDTLLSNYNFIFFAEGINYESEVTINNVIISRNNGGCKFINNEIQENLIQRDNVISIKLSGKLNNSKSFPLVSQSNYSRNYSGVLANIYILAIPKIYISETLIKFTYSADNTINLTNNISVNSLYLDTLMLERNKFFVKTSLIRISDSAVIHESSISKFDPKNYQNYKLTNTLSFKNVDSWTIENPILYLLSTSIYYDGNLIDNVIYETGFNRISVKGNELYINESPITIKGINYYEDHPLFASALDYATVEKDLKNIKELGFNTIRVPGKSAHPFVIRNAQRIGLFVLQEYPFNEVPPQLLKDADFIQDGLDYMSNIVKRDIYSPAIIAWGIGNDFDVTTIESEQYAAKIKENIGQYDFRPLYYTTKNLKNDKLSAIIKFKGYNINESNYNIVKADLEGIEKAKISFISSLGIATDNNNRNGFGDIRSAEYQAKYLTEIIGTLKSNQGFIISSFADFNTDSPLIIHYDKSQPSLKTDGIYDYFRNPKYVSTIIKRMLNNQGYQKIPEGNVSYVISKSSNYFVVFGIILFIFLLFALSKIRYFKDNILKSIITPRNFLFSVKEQNDVPHFHSIILVFFLSATLSLFFSSILYNLRVDSGFEIILSKLTTNYSVKLFIIEILNNPALMFMLLLISITSLFFLSYLLVNLFVKVLRSKAILKPSFAVTTWSFVLFILLLPFGIILSKILDAKNTTIIYISMYIYLGIFAYSLLKLLNGIKYVYELGLIKSYFYGLLVIAIILSVNYYYFVSYKSLGIFIDLINSYN